MLNRLLFGFSFLAFLAAGFVAVAWQPDNSRRLQVVDGTTTVSFLPSVLDSKGLKISFKETSGIQADSAEPTIGFRISPSTLTFVLVDGRFDRVEKGTVSHDSGFVLSNGRHKLDASSFSITQNEQKFELTVGKGRSAFVAFDLLYPRTLWDMGQLYVGSMDMVITAEGAKRLGKPSLAGQLVGTLGIVAEAKPIDGKGEIDSPPLGNTQLVGSAPIDVRISALSSLTVLGRLGTFPNGRNGLSMSTTSCNVGTQNIQWFAPMDNRHPVIALNLYRIMNGRFEQVGWSWLKHGFLSTNSNGCGSCQHPGTGTLLGVNCSDTYGTGNNGDRFYLGGRDEVNPFTGVWTCENSYFSNFQNDCVRRRPSSGEFTGDPVTHRLEVLDGDLGNSGATYYYEAYYINANDFDKYNNVSHRQASFSWGGSSWSVTNMGTSQTQGPAIDRWGELRNIAEPRDEGDVIVGVQTTDLGNGMWHYEFAVYNHDYDRQVKEFSVPLPIGTVVQNIGFRDIDQNAGNQWANTNANGVIKWTTANNPLKYSSVFNFRFDADVPPMKSMATLLPFKPADGIEETAAVTRGPLYLTPISSYQLISANQTGGDLQSLSDRDQNRLGLTPAIAGSRSGSGIETSMTAPAGTFSVMNIGVIFRNSLPPSGGGNQAISLWNWSTSQWVQVASDSTLQADQFKIVKLTSNVMSYINPSTREVRAKIIHTSALGAEGYRWTFAFDQVGFQFE